MSRRCGCNGRKRRPRERAPGGVHFLNSLTMQLIRRAARAVAGVAMIATLAACDDETPTATGYDLFPGGVSPTTLVTEFGGSELILLEEVHEGFGDPRLVQSVHEKEHQQAAVGGPQAVEDGDVPLRAMKAPATRSSRCRVTSAGSRRQLRGRSTSSGRSRPSSSAPRTSFLAS